ncbi:hypothetical protein MKP08_13735 [Erythrobacter sp. LQ02-29]|uniref:hypothetical protein n=1 Tax=Erythrobacter sp. LQ02-29 TaxID=2920384 RepID=UPI001F4EAACE|nr:hypothetical protein [Erythrobacter sp. LQ02-29]MCP9223804.1 hypothetical protein [Erythrobacter sp. LQ02-29]
MFPTSSLTEVQCNEIQFASLGIGKDPLENLLSGFLTIGGVGAFAWFVARLTADTRAKQWLQKNKAVLDRETETHKADLAKEADRKRLLLKRQELFFAEEVEAVRAFLQSYRSIMPERRTPHEDWSDARTYIAKDIDKIDEELRNLLKLHEAGLSESAIDAISSARDSAQTIIYDMYDQYQETEHEIHLGPDLEREIDRLVDHLNKAKARVRKDLRHGSMAIDTQPSSKKCT